MGGYLIRLSMSTALCFKIETSLMVEGYGAIEGLVTVPLST